MYTKCQNFKKYYTVEYYSKVFCKGSEVTGLLDFDVVMSFKL